VSDADRAAVEAFLAARDEGAFAALYRRHAPALYPAALRLVGGHAGDAEDAVQETWIRAVERLAGFRWRSSLRTWLTGITVNCCRELLRRRAARPDASGAESVEPSARTDAPLLRLDLAAAVDALAPGYREVLVLHDVLGHTHDEIAELLGVAAGTSKSQLSRARAELRRRLDGAPTGGQRP